MPAPNSFTFTETCPYGEAAILRAAELVRAGWPVAIPTETVYGLAADATSGIAIARIYEAKGRPAFNPLIVHVADAADAEQIATLDNVAHRLAAAFWPGPLTLVLPSTPSSPVAALARAGLATIAVRSPAHPAMRALLAAVARPLAAPSANRSGTISPTRAQHVARTLTGQIPLIVDAGPSEVGMESTIVAISPGGLRVLRPGPIGSDALAAVAGVPVDAATSTSIEAPGQLASHYAPSSPLRLDARRRLTGEWLIGFGEIEGDDTLSADGRLDEAAARLFDALHRADASGADRIAVAPIPATGLGLAINDRLARAAAPR